MENKFLTITNTRIKLSNIKQYGIKTKDKESSSSVIGILIDIWKEGLFRTEEVLYIKTYQNENHEFTGEGIREKLTELDNYFNKR